MSRISNKPTKLGVIALLVMAVMGLVMGLASCTQAPTNTEHHTQTAQHPNKARIITPDWGIAQTLIEMGHPPIAMGDVRTYPTWATLPILPDDIIDLGLRYEPNPELFAQLSADMVIDNEFYAHLRDMHPAPIVHTVNLQYPQNGDKLATATWQTYADNTQNLGELIGEAKSAADYINQSKLTLHSLGKQIKQTHPNLHKISVVQFSNAQSLRLYTDNSLFQPAANELGLTLVSLDKGNEWGFIDIGLSDLARLDDEVCLIVIEPFSPMLRHELSQNALWQRIGYGQSRCMMSVQAVWIFGGIPSMLNFGNSILHAKPMQGDVS